MIEHVNDPIKEQVGTSGPVLEEIGDRKLEAGHSALQVPTVAWVDVFTGH